MKESRQKRIIEIIRSCDVGTQEELAERLREAGFSATQATVSRDIRELRLTKAPVEEGGQRYVVPETGDRKQAEPETGRQGDCFVRVLRDALSSMAPAQNLLVARTMPGMAMAVAAAVDAMCFEEVVGCIAGDDTVFVAARTAEEAQALIERIESVTA